SMHATSVDVLLTIRTSPTPTRPWSVSSSTKVSSRHGAPTTIVRAPTIFSAGDRPAVSSPDRVVRPLTVEADPERAVIVRRLRTKKRPAAMRHSLAHSGGAGPDQSRRAAPARATAPERSIRDAGRLDRGQAHCAGRT